MNPERKPPVERAVLAAVRDLFGRGWTTGQIAAEVNSVEWRLDNRSAAYHRRLTETDVLALVDAERLWLEPPPEGERP